ncbi:hypothetical protein TEHN7125_2188 [Tetragenococcus halophilus subsp. halophilus]|nr:hypothetical protein TEHN7125_2188 [Tetragenococcus halophilus subsp. halophilus]
MGELYKIFSGQTPFRGDSENFINTTTAWIKTTDLANTLITSNEEDISNKAKEKLKIFPVGTVLIAMYGGFNQIGRTGLLTYPATINQAISALPPIAQVNSYFLITELNKRVKEWERFAASSRKDPNITKRDVGDFKLKYPTLEEQNKIGIFFKKIDNTIALHQEKITKLQALKKAALQSLLPEKGETEPKVRFTNFSDAWQQRKLEQLGNIYTGNTPSTMDKTNWIDNKMGYVWVTPTDINNLTISNSEKHLSSKGWSKARTVPVNSVLITCIASIGKNTMNTVPAAFNQQINAIVPEENNAYFILTIMEKETKRLVGLAGKTATSIINKREFKKFVLLVPNIDEQIKIKTFFQYFDNNIDLCKQKLGKLQTLKKAFLQKMFM